MSEQNAFERILASLYDAMLDDTRWPATSALIDEACGIVGNALLVAEGPPDDIRVLFVGLYYRGQRRLDLEREYLDVYHPINEAIPRQLQLPDGHLVALKDLYTAEELKTSPTYNEALLKAKYQNGLNVLLDGPGGTRMTWSLADPVGSDGWGSSQIAMVRRLMPHIRQFIRVRQALARAGAQATTATALLDNSRIGVIHLDRRGRILEVNDRARGILRRGDRLSDNDGMLSRPRSGRPVPSGSGWWLTRCRHPALSRVSGSMLLGRAAAVPPFVVHVKPVGVSATRLWSAARRGAGPDCRAGAPSSYRSGPGGQRPEADPGRESGGGLVGRRQERARHRLGDRAHGRRHLLAPEADLPETADLPAGGPGAVGAVDRRVQVATPLLASSSGGPEACRFLFIHNRPIFLQILPMLAVTGRH